MVRKTTQVDHAALWRRALGPWALRAGALLAVGAVVGVVGTRISPWLPLALAPPLAVLYLWVMRPLYVEIPLPARVRPWLTRLRLLPG
jgi:hypothetical protein